MNEAVNVAGLVGMGSLVVILVASGALGALLKWIDGRVERAAEH